VLWRTCSRSYRVTVSEERDQTRAPGYRASAINLLATIHPISLKSVTEVGGLFMLRSYCRNFSSTVMDS